MTTLLDLTTSIGMEQKKLTAIESADGEFDGEKFAAIALEIGLETDVILNMLGLEPKEVADPKEEDEWRA